MSVVYGTGRTRITLYSAAGTPTYRLTLQIEQHEGLKITFTPEGQEHLLGSGAGFIRAWTHRGWRPRLDVQWDWGLQSTRETYGSGVWGAPETVDTVRALGQILSAAMRAPCLVEPHMDHSFAFYAQADPQIPWVLQDTRRVLHGELVLGLIGTGLIADIPTW